MFDIFAILAYVPASVRFVAKRELGRIPVFSTAMRAAGHVFIDRRDRRSASRVMREAGRRMKREGLSLGLFPEGTRSRTGALQGFKKGTFVLAIETQVEILPIAVDGGYRIAKRGRIHTGEMRLSVGTPLSTDGLASDARDEVLAAVRDRISRMLEAGRSDPASRVEPTAGRA
jgi:1-acyl-sn-glycerol-3-phosphate acyltransferase